MRHRKSFNHLSRKAGHRKAMMANMASSLIMHKRIKTTTAKAKALRMYLEPLITKSKDDSTHSRRVVFSYLQSKEAVSELFREVSPKVANRPGGYTRILKTGTRLGDNADMCIIELVDYNENLLTAKEDAAGKSGRRRRRGGKKKSGSTEQTTATAAPADAALDAQPQAEEDSPDAEPKAEATAGSDTKAEDVSETGDEAKAEEPSAEAKTETAVEEAPESKTDVVKAQTEESAEESESKDDSDQDKKKDDKKQD